jgi:hypothetical protein
VCEESITRILCYQKSARTDSTREVRMAATNPKPKIRIVIDDLELEAEYREFKSLKKGYGSYGIIKIGGYPYRLSLNIIEM